MRVASSALQLAAHAHHRRRADGDVEVRGVQLDDFLQDCLRNRFPSPLTVSPLIGSHRRTRNSRNFLDRGEAHADLVDAVLLERAHALLDRDRRGSRSADARSIASSRISLVTSHRLVEADPALVAGVAAALAALGLRRPRCRRRCRSCASASARISDRLLAVRAEQPREALGDHAVERGGGQEGLDAHLGQARDRRRRVVRVQRREHEVAGERRLDRDLGRLACRGSLRP